MSYAWDPKNKKRDAILALSQDSRRTEVIARLMEKLKQEEFERVETEQKKSRKGKR